MLFENLGASIQAAADALFMPWTVALLMLSGLFLSLRLGFVQIVRLPDAVRAMLSRPADEAGGALSPFQAFMTALAASIGTGNIAGVAAAVVTGGPGVVFWIWCYGFFATSIKFCEAVLGLRFRSIQADGHLSGGPMHYLRDGLRSPALAWAYGLIAGVAALTTTPFTQTNSIADVWRSQVGVPTWASGAVVAVLAWLVIIGGVKSIGRAAERLAPLKVGLYLAGGLWVIVTHAALLPSMLALIVREAFSLQAAAGTATGVGVWVAIRYGLARGIYANEAGYGTAAVAYATARSRAPLQQGLNAVMEVFIVSFGTSTVSALVVLLSGAWRSGQTGASAVAEGFNSALPGAGGYVVAFCVFLFGYTTLIGWAYYGEQYLEYIFGRRIVLPYRWVYCLLIVPGAISKVETVWAWGDLMNGLQIFPNMIGVLGLSGLAAAVLREGRARA
jgi:AGCS family alanine or glycine:cation symporter